MKLLCNHDNMNTSCDYTSCIYWKNH